MRHTKLHGMCIALGMYLALGHAAVSAAAGLAPTSAFVQAGIGDQRTTAYTAGLSWDLPWHYEFKFGRLGAYAEAAVGRWRTDGHREATAWPTQISATPTLRLYPARAPQWFAEAGVGANYIVPIFNSGEKRFSTEFNFGDHVAIGRDFGHSEVSIRMEHFSNAGIEHPNPGENFGQLRYAYRF
jgi:lipid A 3-O-deacylase